MSNHKVLSARDNKKFIKTRSFHELCQVLSNLKTSRGHFVLVLGAPGTGKSANIYRAVSLLDLEVYDAFLFIDKDTPPYRVFKIFWESIITDMGVANKNEVYHKARSYDLVLFADPFLDSEYIDQNKVGLGLWTEENGPNTAPFYFRVLYEYLKHWRDIQKVNVVAQTSWVLKFQGVRYDILTDFGFLSRFLVFLLKQLFEVVLISYSPEELIKIIKNHPNAASETEIEGLIKKFGKRPRLIFEELDKKG